MSAGTMRERLGTLRQPIGTPHWRLGVAIIALLGAQTFLSTRTPREWQHEASPGTPPSIATATLASLGESVAAGYAMTLYTQTFDAQAGTGVRIATLDAAAIEAWLDRAIDLDPATGYPLLLAARVYGEVFPRAPALRMIAMVHRRFLEDPQRRWPWLAHSVHVARHALKDLPLALELTRSLRQHATGPGIPSWVSQAEPLLLADMGREESARVLLGALLSSGTITDAAERTFLTGRLRELGQAAKGADSQDQSPRESAVNASSISGSHQ